MAAPEGERDGSPQESYSDDGTFSATRTILVPWADRKTDLDALWGTAYPNLASTRAVAKSATVQGVGKIENSGGDDNVAAYQWAELTVAYKQPTGGSSGGNRTVKEWFEPTLETLMIDAQAAGCVWTSAAGSFPVDPRQLPSLQVRAVAYCKKIMGVSSMDIASLNLLGKVNSTAITMELAIFGSVTFPAETLLLSSITLSEVYVGEDETDMVDVTYRLCYRQGDGSSKIGWNVFWNPSSRAYDQIWVYNGDRIMPFTLANLSTLPGFNS